MCFSIDDCRSEVRMDKINQVSGISNLWKTYNSMPTKTTALDRIVEKEKSAQKEYVSEAIKQATSSEHIQSKQVTSGYIQRLQSAKDQQSKAFQSNLAELKRFMGKGLKFDAYA